MQAKTPVGRLRFFQLLRLERALQQRETAGNDMAVRLTDKAITSLLRACEDAGAGDVAGRLMRGHRARMGAEQ